MLRQNVVSQPFSKSTMETRTFVHYHKYQSILLCLTPLAHHPFDKVITLDVSFSKLSLQLTYVPFANRAFVRSKGSVSIIQYLRSTENLDFGLFGKKLILRGNFELNLRETFTLIKGHHLQTHVTIRKVVE